MSAIGRIRSLPTLYRDGVRLDGWCCYHCYRPRMHEGRHSRRSFVAVVIHGIVRHGVIPAPITKTCRITYHPKANEAPMGAWSVRLIVSEIGRQP